MPSIQTLVPDIYELVQSKGGWDAVSYEAICTNISRGLSHKHRSGGLRLSAMGDRCPRALWYSVKHPELAELLPPYAVIKYAYGHIIEALMLELARAAGHDVQGEQDEIILDGVVGHRDCVIDGAIVDIKSASTLGFKKFKNGEIAQSDSFGYLDQLDAYVVGSVMAYDPLVTVKDRGYNLVVDKTLGHVVLYEHFVREKHIKERVRSYKEITNLSEAPRCGCNVIADGKSGNLCLDTKASYSPYRHCCFPGLRTFLNSKGQPVEYVKVVKHPSYHGIPFREITKCLT